MYVTMNNFWIEIKKKKQQKIHSLGKLTHTNKTGLGQPALPSMQEV